MRHVTGPTHIVTTVALFLLLFPQKVCIKCIHILHLIFRHPHILYSANDFTSKRTVVIGGYSHCFSTAMYVLPSTSLAFDLLMNYLAALLFYDHDHGRQTRTLVAA